MRDDGRHVMPIQDVDISEEELQYRSGGIVSNFYGKYDSRLYPEEYKMFIAKFGSLI